LSKTPHCVSRPHNSGAPWLLLVCRQPIAIVPSRFAALSRLLYDTRPFWTAILFNFLKITSKKKFHSVLFYSMNFCFALDTTRLFWFAAAVRQIGLVLN
jgi:hypothetical protein